MKTIRCLILAGITAGSLCAPRTALAQASTPPPPPPVTVAPNDGVLPGVPKEIKTLILDFGAMRDVYLAKQDLLLAKLGNATTAAEREAIREQLQDNRDSFLASLKTFRGKLQDDLTALKGKLSHAEIQRILDAAREAATEGGVGHHKGQ